MSKIQSKNPTKSVLIIVVGFVILSLVYKSTQHGFLIAAGLVGLFGALSDKMAYYIDWVWMKLAYILGLIIPKILLSLVFYLVLMPTAFLSKLFSKKERVFLKDNKKSFFIEHPVQEFTPEMFEKTW